MPESTLEPTIDNDALLRELAPDLLERVIQFLRLELTEDERAAIRRLHAEHKSEWVYHMTDLKLPSGARIPRGHFGWGMALRNGLRAAGFDDTDLPRKNWDEYYVPVVEVAIGLRPMPSEERAASSTPAMPYYCRVCNVQSEVAAPREDEPDTVIESISADHARLRPDCPGIFAHTLVVLDTPRSQSTPKPLTA